jgi:hypothetical protein
MTSGAALTRGPAQRGVSIYSMLICEGELTMISDFPLYEVIFRIRLPFGLGIAED